MYLSMHVDSMSRFWIVANTFNPIFNIAEFWQPVVLDFVPFLYVTAVFLKFC